MEIYMRYAIISCFTLLSLSSPSQKISIKFPFLSLIDEASFPTIQSGIEFRLAGKISSYNEAGIKYRKSYYEMADTGFVRSRGFKVKSEIRYYLHKHRHDVYIGANGFYTKDFHNTAAGYYYNGDSSNYIIDNFSAKKIVRGVNIIAGKSGRAWRGFTIDVYAGVGIRFIFIESKSKEVDLTRDILRRSPDYNIPDNRIWMDVTGGNFVLPNFSLGIRLCYSFK